MQEATVETIEQMPQAVRVWPVLVRLELQVQQIGQPQFLSDTIQKPRQFLNLQVGAFDPQQAYRRTNSAISARAGVSSFVPARLGAF